MDNFYKKLHKNQNYLALTKKGKQISKRNMKNY